MNNNNNIGRPRIHATDAVQFAFKCSKNLRDEFLAACGQNEESGATVLRKMMQGYIEKTHKNNLIKFGIGKVEV